MQLLIFLSGNVFICRQNLKNLSSALQKLKTKNSNEYTIFYFLPLIMFFNILIARIRKIDIITVICL